ncbi:MAG: GC-type dockerin domain-anchored protein [Phycisphaerales bacterium]|nr:GC-type dockerin domain-anchored protein [Phycisphaerales bacterium]
MAYDVRGQDSTGGLTCSIEGSLGQFSFPEGYTYSIDRAGDVVFALHWDELLDQPTLNSVDLSNTENPTLLQTIAVDFTDEAEVGSGLLIMNLQSSGIAIFDVSDPSAMHEISTLDTTDEVSDILIQGQTAFLIDRSDGLIAVDLSDPTNPTTMDTYLFPSFVRDIALNDSKAYVSLNSEQLIILDISDPANFEEIMTFDYDVLSFARIAVDDGILVLYGRLWMQVFDIQSGENELIELSKSYIYELAGDLHRSTRGDLHLDGGFLTVLSEYGNVFRFSLADPAKPVLTGQLASIGPYSYELAVMDSGVAVVAGGEPGFSVLNMVDANTIVPYSDMWNVNQIPDYIFEILGSNNVGYENNLLLIPVYRKHFIDPDMQGVMALDMTDPESPVIVSEYYSEMESITDIVVHNEIAYIVRESFGLELVDFSTPTQPKRILTYEIFKDIVDIEIHNETLWLQVDRSSYAIFDINNIEQIDFLAFYQVSHTDVYSSTFADDRIFISHEIEIDDASSFVVSEIDLSDPFRPLRTDHVTPTIFEHIQIDDGVLYGINYSDSNLFISSLDDLDSYGEADLVLEDGMLEVLDGYAHWYTWENQVYLFDVGEPQNPELVGSQYIDFDLQNIIALNNAITLISQYSILTINTDTNCNPCVADMDGDGELNFRDVSAFLSWFNAMSPITDINKDGRYNFFDVTAFLSAYSAGCP